VLRERVSDYFELDTTPLHAAGGARKEGALHSPDGVPARVVGIDKLNVPAPTSGRHAHRLLGPRPDGDARGQRPLLPAPQGFRAAHGLRRAGQHLVQRARRADRLHAEDAYRCFMRTHIDVLVLGRSCSRSRPSPNGRRRSLGSRNSSSTDRRPRRRFGLTVGIAFL